MKGNIRNSTDSFCIAFSALFGNYFHNVVRKWPVSSFSLDPFDFAQK